MRQIESKSVIEGQFRVYRGEELTDEWIYGNESMREPFVVEEVAGLEMEMPSAEITIGEIARIVGGTTPIEVIGSFSILSLRRTQLTR